MHTWSFFRAGGFDQVRLQSAADLTALAELDPKLWAALACPVAGLEFDPRTLALVDTDADGRLRPPEIIAAATWTVARLKNPDELFARRASLPLASIREDGPEGARLLRAARQVLKDLGKPDADAISVEDTSDITARFAAKPFNGDGVVPPESADDPELRALLADVVACVGGVPDLGGAPGVDQAQLDAFFAAAEAHERWWREAEADPALRPLGDATPAAHEALQAVMAKVDDFFARTRLAAFDARATDLLNRPIEELAAVAGRDLATEDPEVARLPLAHVAAGARLPLGVGVNPAWTTRMARLEALVVRPLLGELASLDEATWTELRGRLAPHAAWRARVEGAAVAGLGLDRVRALLGSDLRARAVELLAKDESLREVGEDLTTVDRLVRYNRDLVTLLQNFVSFRDFYLRTGNAIFQAGTLYVDQRSSELCVRVDNVAQHAGLAARAGTYLAYCDLVRRATSEKMTIVAAITGGDADNLMVGRNGLFVDRRGRDWDATIVRIVEHPISLRQAFWSPYKKIASLIEQQVEKFAAAKQSEVDAASATSVATRAGAATGAAPAAAAAPFDVAKFAGIFAAIGLAIGAIGGAVTALFAAFASLALWQMPVAILGLMLVVSGPAMLMAALKLRRRNLGPLLDASGWAINANARMNIPFGESLTRLAHLPAGARRSLDDPFAESRRGRVVVAVGAAGAAAAVLWWTGVAETWAPWLPDSPRVTAPSTADVAPTAPLAVDAAKASTP